MLGDEKTLHSYLIKFPYTDSQNSTLLAVTEKAYYDYLRTLPLISGEEILIHANILFIKRFDRIRLSVKRNALSYWGLESFYSAHGITGHGKPLFHENNLKLIKTISSAANADIIEYLQRDLLNKMLANSDNHGRNTSFLKTNLGIRLSPVYDLTAMRFFTGDIIVELTRWNEARVRLADQIAWITANLGVPAEEIMSALRRFAASLNDIGKKLAEFGVPLDFIQRSEDDRQRLLKEIYVLIA